MNKSIKQDAKRRGITRLCHFTPSRNLMHIARESRGLRSTNYLTEKEHDIYNPTDTRRNDGFLDHVCCSIQYPNAWYLRTARERDRLMCDWVVLLISERYLWVSGTKFCPRNAAALRGMGCSEGYVAFERLFAPAVQGSKGKVRERHGKRSCIPTDDQAEVLVPDPVKWRDLFAIVVKSESQARRERFRLRQVGAEIQIGISSIFFRPEALNSKLKQGKLPRVRKFQDGS